MHENYFTKEFHLGNIETVMMQRYFSDCLFEYRTINHFNYNQVWFVQTRA